MTPGAVRSTSFRSSSTPTARTSRLRISASAIERLSSRSHWSLWNTDAIKPKERKHLRPEDFEAGYRMACQTFVNGDVKVSWVIQNGKGVVVGAASDPVEAAT